MGFYGIDHPNPNTPQFSFPRRGGAKLSGTAIVHTAEMYGALNTAAFCMRRSDYGCYHTIVDDKTIIEIYPYEYETWQDSETNNWAVGISAACRAADWNSMTEAQREGYYRNLAWAAADFVIYMRTVYGIEVPRRKLSGEEARARKPGFCAHGDSGIARSDPGRDFDWGRFFRYTDEILNGEDEMAMPTAGDIARAILDFKVDAVETGGQINLGAMLAEYRVNNNRITEATAKWIMPELVALRELVKQLSVAQGVVIDYEAIAKAVNDDAAKRLKD